MNDEHLEPDPLEEELHSMQPVNLSDGFMKSLGERLESAENVPQPRRRSMTHIVVSLASIAALVLIATWLVRHLSVRDDVDPSPTEIALPNSNIDEEQPDELIRPTLFAYSSALTEQKDLEELLDYHGRTLLPQVPDPIDSQWSLP